MKITMRPATVPFILSSPFLHEVHNEILAFARMKSANADEIFSYASDEIKSTHPASSRISPPQGISSSKMIYSTRQGGFS